MVCPKEDLYSSFLIIPRFLYNVFLNIGALGVLQSEQGIGWLKIVALYSTSSAQKIFPHLGHLKSFFPRIIFRF